jgi:hypothetical protein
MGGYCHGTCHLDLDPGRQLECGSVTTLALNVKTVRVAARDLCVKG